MKNFLRSIFIIFLGLRFAIAVNGATGIFQTYIFISLNGSGNLYEGNITNPNNNDFPNFDGLTLNNPSSLILTGAEAHTFKNSGGDVTGGTFYYRVYQDGATPPSYSSFNLSFGENCSGNSFTGGAQCTAENNDQKWLATGLNIDLLAGVTGNGTFQIDAYLVMFSNQGNPTDGTSSNPLTATVQVSSFLPVTLTRFQAKELNPSTLLSWSTATETNNAHFEVQRSAGSRDWEVIGKVKGAGTTQEAQHYTYADHEPLSGLSYYRLRQVDYDGQYAFSPVVAVDRKEAVFSFTAFPNPAPDVLYISLPAREEPLTAEVYDACGRRVRQQTLPARAARQEIHLSGLPPGLYCLAIADRQGRRLGTGQFVKR